MQCFKTVLQSINGATTPIVIAIVPFHVETVFGVKNRVDINGRIDNHPIQRTLLPDGDGGHYFMLNAPMMKAIGKKAGDEVYIEIEEQENTDYKIVVLPDYFIAELDENLVAKTEYELTNPSGKRNILLLLTEPKSLEAKANRVIKVLEMLERNSQRRAQKKAAREQ
jgi:hypothetical protein